MNSINRARKAVRFQQNRKTRRSILGGGGPRAPHFKSGLETLEPRMMLSSSTGAAPFTAPVFTSLPAAPTLVSLPSSSSGARVNPDQLADTIVEWNNGNGTITFAAMVGQSDGTFQEHVIGSVIGGTILSAQAVDLNNDGNLDLVVLWQDAQSPTESNLAVYMGNGDGTFNANPIIPTFVNGVLSVEDMNGDGNPDLLVEDGTRDAVDVYLNQGNTTFAPAAETDFGAGHTIVEIDRDVNADGIADAILNYSTGGNRNLEVHLGESDGLFSSTASFTDSGNQTQFVGLYNFSGDSLPDILATQQSALDPDGPGNVVVFKNLGSGTFTNTFSKTLANGVLYVTAGNVNGDGDTDLVIFEGSPGSATVTAHVELGGASDTFTDGQTLTFSNFIAGSLQDVDNDGSPDLVIDTGSLIADSGISPAVSIYFNNNDGSGTFVATPVTVTASIPGATFGIVTDLNGDHQADVYFPGATTDQSGDVTSDEVSVFINNGNRTFGSEQITNFGANTEFNYLADLNGDNIADAVVFQDVAPGSNGDVADGFKFYTGNANGTFNTPGGEVTTAGTVSAEQIDTDFTGNGTQDLVLLGQSDPGLYTVLQNGALNAGISVSADGTPLTSGQPMPVNFGTAAQFATPAPSITFTVENISNQTVDLGPVVFPAGYSFGSDTLSASLVPGDSDTFTVNLSTDNTGVISGNIEIPTSEDAGSPFVIPVTGTITGNTTGPIITVSDNGQPITSGQATPIDYGSVVQNSTPPSMTFTVQNTGDQALTIGTIAAPTGYTIASNTLGSSLDAGSSGTLTVDLSTADTGTFSGNVSITNGDSGLSPFLIPVTGTVTAPVTGPIITVSDNGQPITSGQATPIDYGSVVQNSTPPSMTFTVQNTGDQALTIGTIAAPTGYTIASNTLGSSLDAGSSGTLTVDLSTADTGTFSGNVSITNGDSGLSPFLIPITGTVTAPTTSTLTSHEKLTFKDANGSTVTVSYSGDGTAVVTRGVPIDQEGDIQSIAITGSDVKSSLTISVKGGTDNGLTTVGTITDDSPINVISASGADLTGPGVVFSGQGYANSLTLHDLDAAASIVEPGMAAKGVKITVAAVGDGATINVASGLALQASDWSGGGSITAPYITSLKITGDKKRVLAGNLGANITLSGVGTPANKPTLGTTSVAGSITGGTWTIDGAAGNISAASIAGLWMVDVEGAIGSISVKNSASGTIQAASIKSLNVKGDLTDATITLTQAGNPNQPTTATLGTLTVGGTLDHSQITSAGYVKSVSVGAMNDSTLLVGTAPGVTGLPATAADFVYQPAKPSLGSFTVRGLKGESDEASFAGSDVDAWSIGNASLKLVDTTEEASLYGFGADQIGSISFKAASFDNGKKTITLKKLESPADLDNPKNNPSRVTFPIGSFTLVLVQPALA